MQRQRFRAHLASYSLVPATDMRVTSPIPMRTEYVLRAASSGDAILGLSDRKSVVSGKSVYLGGRCIIK